jgi:excinuclease ABC subunit A
VIFRCRGTLPAVIGVRGARHDNLGDVDADVPLWRTVPVAAVSGSGKTSLAMGTPCAEGLHWFLDSPRCLAATAPIMTGWP